MLFDVDHIAIYTWKSKRYILINKHFMAVLKTKKQCEIPQPLVLKLCNRALSLQSETQCMKELSRASR